MPQAEEQLDLDQALRVLHVIRTGVDSLILTGGEPLLHPDIDQLHHAREERSEVPASHAVDQRQPAARSRSDSARARSTRHQPRLDRSRHLERDHRPTPGMAHNVSEQHPHVCRAPERIRLSSRRQLRAHAADLAAGARVLDFCDEHHILVSFSPQSVNNWPHYDLLVSQEYRDFIQHLIDRKQAGAPILGSLAYLHTLLDFTPYSCYPLLVPRVMPNGDLVYPCRPIESGPRRRAAGGPAICST